MAPRGRALAHPPPRADGLRRRPRPVAHRPLRERRGADRARLRADVRLRPGPGDVAVHRSRLLPRRGPGGRCRPAADADHRHADRVRGIPGDSKDSGEGGRLPLLRALVERARAPRRLRTGPPAPGVDRAPLAALVGPGKLPRPSLAPLPRAQRPGPQGPHLRADRRAAGRGDDVAPRDPRGRAQLGLPVHVDPRLDVRAVGALHARLQLGGQGLLLVHRRCRGPRRAAPGPVRHRRRT